MRALDDDPNVDRNFAARGPLVNRLITAPHPALVPHQRPAPPLAGPARRRRPRRTAASSSSSRCRRLAVERLRAMHSSISWPRSCAARARATRLPSPCRRSSAGLFSPDYTADQKSWKASELIDRFRDGFSLRADRLADHRTAAALASIADRPRPAGPLDDARHRDRRARHHPGARPDAGLARRARRGIARRRRGAGRDAWRRPVRCRGRSRRCSRRRWPPSTCGRARWSCCGCATPDRARRDAETVFMHGHWNACPAQAFVTELVRAVWRRSSN